MAKQPRNTLKTYFETGDKPNQAEFINLIDSIPTFSNDDSKAAVDGSSTIENVQGLVAISTDAKAKSGTNTPTTSGVVTVARPSQLPTAQPIQLSDTTNPYSSDATAVSGTNDAVLVDANIDALETAGLNILQQGGNANDTVRVEVDSTSTRNSYRFRLSNAILNWLGSRIAPFVNATNPGDTGLRALFYQGANSYKWKSFIVGSGLTLTNNTNDITLANSQTPGETNTASNVGSGSQVYKEKSGVDLRFRSLNSVANTNVNLVQETNEITFATNRELYVIGADISELVDSFNGVTGVGKYQTVTISFTGDGVNLVTSFATGSRVRLTLSGNTQWIEGIVTGVGGSPTNTLEISTDRCSGTYTVGSEVIWIMTLSDGNQATAFTQMEVSNITDEIDGAGSDLFVKKQADNWVSFRGFVGLAANVDTGTSGTFATLDTQFRPLTSSRIFIVPVTTGTNPLFARITITTAGAISSQLLLTDSLALTGTTADFDGLTLSFDGIGYYID